MDAAPVVNSETSAMEIAAPEDVGSSIPPSHGLLPGLNGVPVLTTEEGIGALTSAAAPPISASGGRGVPQQGGIPVPGVTNPPQASSAGPPSSSDAPPAPAAAVVPQKDSRLNFRKLEPRVLLKYLEHHGLTAKPDATVSELAYLVGTHFDSEPIDEDQVLQSFFMSGMQAANSLSKFDKKRKRTGGGGGGGGGMPHYNAPLPGGGYLPRGGVGGGGRDMRHGQVARVDEEVAARLPAQSADDTTTGWILARVVKYVAERDCYQVRDEDDHSNVQLTPSANVIRLDDSLMDIQKNDTILAVFPDTTSFYRAQVVKVAKRVTANLGPQEVIVRFEDDEDETGRTPCRRCPARHVLRLAQVGRYEPAQMDSYSDGAGSRDGMGGGGGGGARGKGLKDYKAMISHALQKLPNSKGTLKEIFRIIENDFRDDLNWKLEGDGKKTPMWKNQVRKLLVNPRSGFMFINAGEKAYYSQGYGTEA